MLAPEIFKTVVKNTPLIAIDFVIQNREEQILLGKRKNNPAKGFWFVPGGRIVKDERFERAFKRISSAETGMEFSLPEALFLGIYEHMYTDENFMDDPSFSTHYITLAYRLHVDSDLISLPEKQHSGYKWASVKDILEDPQVHVNTKNYFNGFPSFSG